MEHCNDAITPTKQRLQLSENEEEQNVHLTQYIRLIGAICYLCNTRPNLAFNVAIASKFMERPKVSHLAAVKRILRYIKRSIGCEIVFPTMDRSRKCNLLDFTNSNWCEDKYDRKSTTEHIFMFDGTQISWCLKKEPVVALSSCETEYITASLCACQAAWLTNLLKELGNNEGEAVTLLVDNVPTINLAKNPIAHGRSNHI
ncbi:secreted RxLR effector protein 161-like [Vicia villosa]|uniref:secreted RxLR effector protein 161-like n=1 Tax=Vicia villosa TaxID=3911 RepID=UPI00273AE8B0|nr:secreted RxLR effector protein 161-like [Vicia villosa]